MLRFISQFDDLILQQKSADVANDATGHVPKDPDPDAATDGANSPPGKTDATSPPESLFRKLAPSRTRYTILRDEL